MALRAVNAPRERVLLRQNFPNRLAVGEADGAALFGDVLFVGIDAEGGAEGGEDVGDVGLAFDDFFAAVARFAVGLAPFDAAAAEDAGPGGREVVAATLWIDRGGATEFADPQNRRRFEEAAL